MLGSFVSTPRYIHYFQITLVNKYFKNSELNVYPHRDGLLCVIGHSTGNIEATV